MATTTTNTTTCDNCPKQQEHTTPFPAGWGRLKFYICSAAGYIESSYIDAVVCPECVEEAVRERSE